ncbi:PAS domain S-box-containing protein [Silvibacterium bohemicum]|uniref:histidine kinase n=1 Tax=Silvibacterium bohemicum TaxID=1577686 RepID=A0A841JQY3_9BACT|nr:PAS domain-containing sensor histidine kinase [Silvibacterium bohemicum]MBB6143560.1 PAS domain S-box-containing protein [Silvibacterium bohemicum]
MQALYRDTAIASTPRHPYSNHVPSSALDHGGTEKAGKPVLGVAANQTAAALRSALFLSEQKLGANEFDRRERTREHAETNEELKLQAALLQHLPVSAWTLKPDGTPDFVNQGWLDYSGQTLEFVRSHPEAWMTAVHPEDRQKASGAFWEGVRSGQGFAMEARSLRALDGVYRWHLNQAVGLRDAEGKVLKFVGTSTDIDDRKRAEEALRIRELNLLEITETIPEMLWSASSDGVIDYCNGRFHDYTGFSPEQVMRNGWTNLLHPDDVESTADVWKSCVKSGAPYRVEVRMFHAADHTYRWCVTSALPLLDQEGRIVKWHGTVVDMHDWKQSQEELRNTQAELARMMRIMTIGQLTASIAHEVSQPLSGIITNASTCLRMLNSEPPNIDGARETAQRTIRDGTRATDVITRLRTLFSKRQINVERVDLNDAAREVIALLSDELQKHRVMVQHQFNDRLPAVDGDRVQLQQVLVNLFRNASDAMVMVNDRPRRLLIRTDVNGNAATVSVHDSGVGFDPGTCDRLFESFFTTKRDGMGIGLSLSRSIVEAHCGHLWAEKNDGPGATFVFSIPCDSGLRPSAGLQQACNPLV